MALNPNPTAWSMDPASRDPDGAWTGWHFPMARSPNIMRSIPAVVTSQPNMAGRGWRRTTLDYRRRRADSDIDLGICDTAKQSYAQQSCCEKFAHCGFSR